MSSSHSSYGQIYVHSHGFIHKRALGGPSFPPPVSFSSLPSTLPTESQNQAPSASPSLQPQSQIQSDAAPRGANRNVTWISPLNNQTYAPGQTLVAKWETLLALVSPSFRLCLGGPDGLSATVDGDASEDPGNASSGTTAQGTGVVSGLVPAGTPLGSVKHGAVPVARCGSLVNPPIQQEADGLYFVSLALPNVTSTQAFILRLQDVLGFEFDSPPFYLGRRSTPDSSEMDSDPQPAAIASNSVPNPSAPSAGPLLNLTSSVAGTLPSQPPALTLTPRAFLEHLSPRDVNVQNSLLPFDRASTGTMAVAIAIPLLVVFFISSMGTYFCLKRRWKLGQAQKPLILTEKISLRGQRESRASPYGSRRSRTADEQTSKTKQRKEIPKMLASLEDLEDLVRNVSGPATVVDKEKAVKKPKDTYIPPGMMSRTGSTSRSGKKSNSMDQSNKMKPPALPELLFSTGSSAWSGSGPAGSTSRSGTADTASGPPPSHPLPPLPMEDSRSRSLTDSYFRALVNSGLTDEIPPTSSGLPSAVSLESGPRPSPIPEEYQTQLFASPVQEEEMGAALASSPLFKQAHEQRAGFFSGKHRHGSRLRGYSIEEGKEEVIEIGDELLHAAMGIEQGDDNLHVEPEEEEEEEEGREDMSDIILSPMPLPPPTPVRNQEDSKRPSDPAAEEAEAPRAAGLQKGRVAEIARSLEALEAGREDIPQHEYPSQVLT